MLWSLTYYLLHTLQYWQIFWYLNISPSAYQIIWLSHSCAYIIKNQRLVQMNIMSFNNSPDLQVYAGYDLLIVKLNSGNPPKMEIANKLPYIIIKICVWVVCIYFSINIYHNHNISSHGHILILRPRRVATATFAGSNLSPYFWCDFMVALYWDQVKKFSLLLFG